MHTRREKKGTLHLFAQKLPPLRPVVDPGKNSFVLSPPQRGGKENGFSASKRGAETGVAYGPCRPVEGKGGGKPALTIRTKRKSTRVTSARGREKGQGRVPPRKKKIVAATRRQSESREVRRAFCSDQKREADPRRRASKLKKTGRNTTLEGKIRVLCWKEKGGDSREVAVAVGARRKRKKKKKFVSRKTPVLLVAVGRGREGPAEPRPVLPRDGPVK